MGEHGVSLEKMGNMENMEKMENMILGQLRIGECQTTSAALRHCGRAIAPIDKARTFTFLMNIKHQ